MATTDDRQNTNGHAAGQQGTAEARPEETDREAQAEQSGEARPAEGKDAGKIPAEEYQELKDKYLRLYAEFENFRRRSAKEHFDLVATANSKLIAKLTDILDNFGLAFDPKHKAGKLEDFEQGIRLIFNRFRQILEEEGLEEIDPVGAEFDPNLHDALMQQPHAEIPENHVAQVLQKGYKVKSKVIKHAKVVVSTGKPQGGQEK